LYLPIVLVVSSALLTVPSVFAQTPITIHNFGANEKSMVPMIFWRQLLADSQGNLYGTTYFGGSASDGTVFELSPPTTRGASWTETVLHTFVGGSDGANPGGRLVADAAGNLYGATYSGGPMGEGTVYQLVPPSSVGGAWTENVLYLFHGTDGESPASGLLMDAAGNLYGATENGGTCSSSGVIYKLSPPSVSGAPWTETVLHNFYGGCGGRDGSVPIGDLTFTKSGAILAGTFWGGATGIGAIYELVPPQPGKTLWQGRILYSFLGPTDGYHPLGGVIADHAGNLYGTTQDGGTSSACPSSQGCGVVFELSPPIAPGNPWTETTLYAFTGGNDGAAPSTPLIFDNGGNLYGTATEGGIGTCNGLQVTGGCGSIFELSPPASGSTSWVETTLHTFTGTNPDEGLPDSGLIVGKSGKLYGTTVGNGDPPLHGTLYTLKP
jgi:uncharacterized repeat protein (TIGR03803 family)